MELYAGEINSVGLVWELPAAEIAQTIEAVSLLEAPQTVMHTILFFSVGYSDHQ